MAQGKRFRWMSFPGLLVIMVGCALISGDDDDEPVVAALYVKAAILNIRAEPSTKAVVVGRASRGTAMVPTHEAGEWYGVELIDGTIGWVHRDYLSPKR